MHAAEFLTGWDTAVLMVPFFALLGFWRFGLDERAAAPKVRDGGRRFCEAEYQGRAFLTDPDGKPWGQVHRPTAVPQASHRAVEILSQGRVAQVMAGHEVCRSSSRKQ